MDIYIHMIRLKSLLCESKPKDPLFGLGIVDSQGVVTFKLFPIDTDSAMTHHSAGLPPSRERFRYDDGYVEWTDRPSKEAKIAVENYLDKKGLPFEQHSSFWDNQDYNDDNEEDIYNFRVEESVEPSVIEGSKFYWMTPDGEFYEVKYGNHYNWAQRYLGIDLKMNVNDPRYDDAYGTMYQMGWIRLGVSNFSPQSNWLAYNYDTSNPPSQKKIKYLKDFAIESGVHELIDDARRRRTPIDESYYDSLSDDEKNALDMSYFDIGQGDEETTANSYCWIWSRPDQGLRIKKGGTHGHNFSHEIAGNTFKGWYDPEKGMISVVFPPCEERKLGNRRPTEDDIPQQVYQALIRAFGKRKPKFIVFETVTKFQLKQLIKETIKEYKLMNEISYDIDNELDIDEYTYGGWLDPNGKFHAVNYEGHITYARELLRKMGIKDKSYQSTYGELYKLGFIRVVFSGTILYFNYTVYEQNIPAHHPNK